MDPVPALGADSERVLAELGFDADAIEQLEAHRGALLNLTFRRTAA